MSYGFESIQVLSRIIDDTFPSMQCAICYGSRAFPQINSNTKQSNNISEQNNVSLSQIVSPHYMSNFFNVLNEPMIDFIFIVNDSKKWHAQNLSTQNYYHYSTFLRIFGSPFVSYVQSFGPGVLYNPFITISNYNIMIKYGVITTSQLITDLLYWKSLYIAGRLHKPVLYLNNNINSNSTVNSTINLTDFYGKINNCEIIEMDSSEQLNNAIMLNLDYALRVSLLLLISENKNIFTLKELFLIITSLSYCGDNRNSFGSEDIHKLEKIVNGSYDSFVELYKNCMENYIESVNGIEYKFKNGIDIKYLCERLPMNLRNEMIKYDCNIMECLNEKERVNKCIRNGLCNIVGNSSWIQTIKGIVSSGFINSLWYILRKVNKYYKSVNQNQNINNNKLTLQSVEI